MKVSNKVKIPTRILVIQTAFLGDVILATAILESLHNEYPDATLDFLVRKGNEKIVEGHPYIHHLWILDKSRKFSSLQHIIRQIRKEHFDLVINLQRFFTSGAITALSGASETVGFRKNPLSFSFSRVHDHIITSDPGAPHETERNFELITDLPYIQFAPPALYPGAGHFEEFREYLENDLPYICIAPASVWFTKQWPQAKWVEFLENIKQEMQVFLLGGPADQSMCSAIAGLVSNKRIQITVLAGKLSLLGSAAIMKNALMNYVNDSAPLHMCSAVNAPVTAVYCSTVPEFGFTPLSDISHVVEIEDPLPCRPCGLHGYQSCPQGHFKCAKNIPVSKLLATLKK